MGKLREAFEAKSGPAAAARPGAAAKSGAASKSGLAAKPQPAAEPASEALLPEPEAAKSDSAPEPEEAPVDAATQVWQTWSLHAFLTSALLSLLRWPARLLHSSHNCTYEISMSGFAPVGE